MAEAPRLTLVKGCGSHMTYESPASRRSRLKRDRFSSSTAGGIPFLPQFQTRWRDEIPSFTAKALGPPAFLMTNLDSAGVIPPCTPGLYSRQAGLYQPEENSLYGPRVPTDREICDYVFNLAKTRGVTQVAMAAACNVSRQAVTNWKDDGLVPSDHHRALAELLNTTVDGLLSLGRHAPIVNLTHEQLQQLPSGTRDMILQAVQLIDTALRNSPRATPLRRTGR
jgi:DNA-binding XRE family transcriptional regulator